MPDKTKKSRRRSLRNLKCPLPLNSSPNGRQNENTTHFRKTADVEYGSVWLLETVDQSQLQMVYSNDGNKSQNQATETLLPGLSVHSSGEILPNDFTPPPADSNTPEMVRCDVPCEQSFIATPVSLFACQSTSPIERKGNSSDLIKNSPFQDLFPPVEVNASAERETVPVQLNSASEHTLPTLEADICPDFTTVSDCIPSFSPVIPPLTFLGSAPNASTSFTQVHMEQIAGQQLQLAPTETPLDWPAMCSDTDILASDVRPAVKEEYYNLHSKVFQVTETSMPKEIGKAKKERRRSMCGLIFNSCMAEGSVIEGTFLEQKTPETPPVLTEASLDKHVDLGQLNLEQGYGNAAVHETKPNRRRRRSVDVALIEANHNFDKTPPEEESTTESRPSSTSSTSKRRSSLRLYRRQSCKFIISNSITCSASELSTDYQEAVDGKSEQHPAKSQSQSELYELNSCDADSDGIKSGYSAMREEAEEVCILPEVENLYKNKPYKKPGVRTWETIFENPLKGKVTSKQKFRRYLQFENIPVSKLRRRQKKAALNGWPASSFDELTDSELNLKLETLQQDIQDQDQED